jgi:hypothetical protein
LCSGGARPEKAHTDTSGADRKCQA